MKKIIALFGYPMDNSVRAKVFDSMPDVNAYKEKWKKISYFIIAWEAHGEVWYFDDEEN